MDETHLVVDVGGRQFILQHHARDAEHGHDQGIVGHPLPLLEERLPAPEAVPDADRFPERGRQPRRRCQVGAGHDHGGRVLRDHVLAELLELAHGSIHAHGIGGDVRELADAGGGDGLAGDGARQERVLEASGAGPRVPQVATAGRRRRRWDSTRR